MTLYQTYRPKTFKEVVGRDDITAILGQQLKTGTLCHAYLFSGTRGTGKTTIARLLAKAANCPSRDADTGEPCNACDSCRSINESRSQDLVEIDAASNRRIEEIRELREMVKYVPAHSPYKVYIIDEVHMLTREAFNALLKTLEEPPKHALFILATTELAKIPDTIFSRCQHFSFGLVS
ncbi:MAG: DNA polymerase III subunit gamma/tau, partial [Patescibacteria group bacterium]|nr:DNA polymerase III subunit gamma/tau [Patescibacteria group bacterium]